MPVRVAAGTSSAYYLIAFDDVGAERREADGSLLSDTLVQAPDASLRRPVTDVFIVSHGWLGDLPGAIWQYDRWIAAMANAASDNERIARASDGFTPLIVGLHWPSLPWGDEAIPSATALLSSDDGAPAPVESAVDAYAKRIASTPSARAALRVVLETARRLPQATDIPADVAAAYGTLWAESGLSADGSDGRPGADQDGFDPASIIAAFKADGAQAAAPGLLGDGGDGGGLTDALLMPLRMLSFWKMKDRARAFGERGASTLLRRLGDAYPGARFHLMGHSFGCIVVSAAVASGVRGIQSLFLVQGALSLWSYAATIPFVPGTSGYFHRIIERGLVSGPIVATRSVYDGAVGRFYPLGAQLRGQYLLDTEFPRYGGIGAFGIQGLAQVADLPIQSASFNYQLRPGRVYNIDASTVIKNGAGPAGAHNDIAHPEVAHLFWEAVLAGLQPPATVAPDPPTASPSFLSPDEFSALFETKRGFIAPKSGSWLLGESAPPEPAPPPPASSKQTFRGVPSAKPPSAKRGAEPVDPRWLNAEIANHRSDEPLLSGTSYILAFDVDSLRRAAALGAGEIPSQTFSGSDQAEIGATIALTSADFEVSPESRPLLIPRRGRSVKKAEFLVAPLHAGESVITATVHKDGNFLTQLKLTFDVDAATRSVPNVVSHGRPPSAASVVKPRNLSLSIQPAGDGYECIIWGAVQSRARLTVTRELLVSAVATARNALMGVIMQPDATGNYVFQSGLAIPKSQCDAALRPLARAGARLFQTLFFGPGAGADSVNIGKFIQQHAAATTTPLKIQIVAAQTPVPWGLLYVGDVSDATALSWSNFLGFSHIIEQIPLQTTLTVLEPEMTTDPHLQVSVNFNDGIDTQMQAPFVADQKAFWANVRATRDPIRIRQRTTTTEVLEALKDPNNADQLLYFYCHAQAAGLADPGGVDSSSLVLTDARLSLSDLSLDAPTNIRLGGNPLIFINACESAALSAAFYDGFAPYFMAKGARGVVGTECKTPALFAAAWAADFFELFMDGGTIGQAFLDLRRKYLETFNNPLGLCYAVYCDGDTQIAPPLERRPIPAPTAPQPQPL